MITLKEILHTIKEKGKNNGLVNINKWRWPDVDHLMTMGFDMGDDYHMHTKQSPKITIYKKKDIDENKKTCEFFFVEEPKKSLKRFKTFNDVIEFFDNYKQPEIDKNI